MFSHLFGNRDHCVFGMSHRFDYDVFCSFSFLLFISVFSKQNLRIRVRRFLSCKFEKRMFLRIRWAILILRTKLCQKLYEQTFLYFFEVCSWSWRWNDYEEQVFFQIPLRIQNPKTNSEYSYFYEDHSMPPLV